MEKSFWLHRISYHAEVAHPLLERNILSIGFSDFSEKDFIKTCSNNWDKFERSFDEWERRPRSRYSLWRFLYEMKKEDYVVVPSSGAFSICLFSLHQAAKSSSCDSNSLNTSRVEVIRPSVTIASNASHKEGNRSR